MRTVFRKFAKQLMAFVCKLSDNYQSGKNKEQIFRESIWKAEVAKATVMVNKSKAFAEKFGDLFNRMARVDKKLIRKYQDMYIRRQKLQARLTFNIEWIELKKSQGKKPEELKQYISFNEKICIELELIDQYFNKDMDTIQIRENKKTGTLAVSYVQPNANAKLLPNNSFVIQVDHKA